jgi:D-3-phosphoglycerate dehydrogenase
MKILALDENHELLNSGLRNAGFQVDENYNSPKEEILKIISQYEGIIIRSRIPVDKEFLQKAENLKFIGRVGAGLENIDADFALKKGIELINAPEGNRDAVAEHCVGTLLMLMNRLKISDLEVRNGIWKREENRGDELKGKTVGLIGYGNMGKAFAQRLKGFEVEVICFDIKENVEDENANQVKIQEIFEKSDVLSLHVPLTELTRNLINRDFLSKFKKPVYLINTARGKCVNTRDLVENIKSGKVKGACLDVLEFEKSSFENLEISELPEEFQFLIHSEKVILTPHIAGWTVQSKEKLARAVLDKIVEWKKMHNIA